MWDWCRDVSGTDGVLGEVPYGTSSLRQPHVVSPDIHSGPQPELVPYILTGEDGSQTISVCLTPGQGMVLPSLVKSPTTDWRP